MNLRKEDAGASSVQSGVACSEGINAGNRRQLQAGRAVPALRRGQYSTEGVSGNMAYKRRYTDGNTDSFVCVTISGAAKFTGIPNGTYVDAITGEKVTVSNGTLDAKCTGVGNMRVYVLNGPGKIGEDGVYLK